MATTASKIRGPALAFACVTATVLLLTQFGRAPVPRRADSPHLEWEGGGPFRIELFLHPTEEAIRSHTYESGVGVYVSSVGAATNGIEISVTGSAVRKQLLWFPSVYTVLHEQYAPAPGLHDTGPDSLQTTVTDAVIPFAPDRSVAETSPTKWAEWGATRLFVSVKCSAKTAGEGDLVLKIWPIGHSERAMSHQWPVIVSP